MACRMQMRRTVLVRVSADASNEGDAQVQRAFLPSCQKKNQLILMKPPASFLKLGLIQGGVWLKRVSVLCSLRRTS